LKAATIPKKRNKLIENPRDMAQITTIQRNQSKNDHVDTLDATNCSEETKNSLTITPRTDPAQTRIISLSEYNSRTRVLFFQLFELNLSSTFQSGKRRKMSQDLFRVHKHILVYILG